MIAGWVESIGGPFTFGMAVGGVAAAAAAWTLGRGRRRSIATLANLLAALRSGDYSVRLAQRPHRPLGELAAEFNRLADTLHEERLKAQESAALLDDVLAGVDMAILAFDASGRIHLANAAAQRLAGRGDGPLLGLTLEEAGLSAFAAVQDDTLRVALPGGEGSFHVRSAHMRRDGRPLQVRLVNDIGKALREKEEEAWRRLVRVMAHEINNSLAPIQSITDTVASGLASGSVDQATSAEYVEALRAVGARAAGLNRFLQPYSRLARLPEPQPRAALLAPILGQVCAVLGIAPRSTGLDAACVLADPPLLEQVLINLLRNALESGGPRDAIEVRVDDDAGRIRVAVVDRGRGIPSSDNLFVPFFTTKPEGSGIGLVLCRQIIEAHGGRLLLRNREDAPGAEAVFTLPRALEAKS